jgi:hypothetical protein
MTAKQHVYGTGNLLVGYFCATSAMAAVIAWYDPGVICIHASKDRWQLTSAIHVFVITTKEPLQQLMAISQTEGLQEQKCAYLLYQHCIQDVADTIC